jgi:hypothetical protein
MYYEVTIRRTVTSQMIADLFVSAIEGNSATRSWCEGIYWMSKELEEQHIPENTTEPGVVWYADPKVYDRPDFCLEIWDHDGESYKIFPDDIKRGLDLMGHQYPRALFRVFDEEYDADDSDTFLQLVVLGEVVYG